MGLLILYYTLFGPLSMRLVPFTLWFPDGLLFLLGGALSAGGEERGATVVAIFASVLFALSLGITLIGPP